MKIPTFFLRCLVGGLIALAAAVAASPVSAQTVPVTFKNNTGGKVNIFWLDSNNNNAETQLGEIAAGGEGSSDANRGDTWVVRDLAGRMLGRYRITKAETFQIGGGSVGPADGARVFRVKMQDVNDRLKLTAPGAPNLDQDSLLFVSQVRTTARTNGVLPGPFSLSYVTNLRNQSAFWTVSPQSGMIPVGCEFNVFVATPEVAFRHSEVTGGAPISYFNHQLVNGNDSVILFVNKVFTSNGGKSHPLGIHWNDQTQRWGVVYTDGSPIEKGAAFNVLALPFEAGDFVVAGQSAMLSDWTSAEELAPANQAAGALTLPFPVTADDFLFTTFDAAPPGLAIDEAVPNPHDPLLTLVGQEWHVSNGDRAALPGKSRFVMLAVTAAATPAPPGAGRTVQVVNTTRKIVTVTIDSVPPIEDFVDPQSTQKFDGVPDGAQVTVRGGASDPPLTVTVSGPTTVTYPGSNPQPVGTGFFVTVKNRSENNVTVKANGRSLGVVEFGKEKQYREQYPTGSVVIVSDGTINRPYTINNTNLTIEWTDQTNPPPVNSTFRVTVKNRAGNRATAYVLDAATQEYVPLGVLNSGETRVFPGQPNGAKVHVIASNANPVSGTIAGSDLSLTIQ